MGEKTEISWTHSTFNAWVGCQKVSPACDSCYAEAWSKRSGMVQWGPHGARKRTSVHYWNQPKKWNREAQYFLFDHGCRRRVFCCSLADVFDNKADPEWRIDLFRLIHQTPELDWLLLTKRPQNIAPMFAEIGKRFGTHWWGDGWPNVWLGTTCEDEHYYRQRYSALAKIPAAVHFISYEPAVGDLGSLEIGAGRLPDWIISGGESGPKTRVFDPVRYTRVRDRCQFYGIAYFHKQFGNYASHPLVLSGSLLERDAPSYDPPSNGKGGALLDGRLWREFPKARTCSGRMQTAGALEEDRICHDGAR